MAYSVVENRFRRHCDRRSAPVNERLFPFASARSALPRALRLRARRLAFTFPRSPIRSPRAFPRTREAWKTAAATNTTPGIPVFPAPTALIYACRLLAQSELELTLPSAAIGASSKTLDPEGRLRFWKSPVWKLKSQLIKFPNDCELIQVEILNYT
jgi:hypothetical protein